MSTHHRPPKDLGGTDNGSNLVEVDLDRHEAWHRLFGTLNPYSVISTINREFIMNCHEKLRCYSRDHFNKVGQQGCKDKFKRLEDWRFLFGKMSVREIAQELSSTWLPKGTVVIAV